MQCWCITDTYSSTSTRTHVLAAVAMAIGQKGAIHDSLLKTSSKIDTADDTRVFRVKYYVTVTASSSRGAS